MTPHSPWFVPLPRFFCLVATGNDRRKFLHNFCTNDIRELPDGQFAEAFFVDVRARVLGHGWILANADRHEIWGIAGDPAALLKHLNKYVITEDVQFRDASQERVFFAAVGTALSTLELGTEIIRISIPWGGHSLSLCSVPAEFAGAFRSKLTAEGIHEAPDSRFEALRIAERWPVVGVDISADHLAPEAERNDTAISYRKGCYLGQEPIARLDAMGHVNKALRCLVIDTGVAEPGHAEVIKTGVGPIGVVSSVAPVSESRSVGLAMIRTHGVDLSTGITVQLPSGNAVNATVQRLGEPPSI